MAMQSADGTLIGPFNPLLDSPEISESFWDWQHAEGQYTTLSDREREVVILSVGAVWRASYELYSHSAAARTAGLSPEQVDTLAGGAMPDQVSTREQCAWRFAHGLSASVPKEAPKMLIAGGHRCVRALWKRSHCNRATAPCPLKDHQGR